MKVLSIRQPWAWLIVNGWKDIENRNWRTMVRGRVLVHASKGMTRKEYDHAVEYAKFCGVNQIPAYEEMERGGIVGSVEIDDCTSQSDSLWFFGKYGFVLQNPEQIPFVPLRGQLGFFDAPDETLQQITLSQEHAEAYQ